MATPAVVNPPVNTASLELETLQLLPCGCVTAVRRARPWEFIVVSIEAKGPHCNLAPHSLGRVVVGDRLDIEDDEDDEEPFAG